LGTTGKRGWKTLQTVCYSRVLSTSIRNQRTQPFTIAMEENKKKVPTRRVHEEGQEKKTSVSEILAKKKLFRAQIVFALTWIRQSFVRKESIC